MKTRLLFSLLRISVNREAEDRRPGHLGSCSPLCGNFMSACRALLASRADEGARPQAKSAQASPRETKGKQGNGAWILLDLLGFTWIHSSNSWFFKELAAQFREKKPLTLHPGAVPHLSLIPTSLPLAIAVCQRAQKYHRSREVARTKHKHGQCAPGRRSFPLLFSAELIGRSCRRGRNSGSRRAQLGRALSARRRPRASISALNSSTF